MKLLPSPDTARRALRGDDGLTRGIDAALTLGLFFGLGYAADRWLGTTPVLTVVGSVLAVVGLFLCLEIALHGADGGPRGTAP